MKLQKLYHLIGLEAQAVEALDRAGGEIDWGRAGPYLDQLLDVRTAYQAYRQLSALLKEDPSGFKLLYCYLECAWRAYEVYRNRGIPEQVYLDTMRCFPRFLAECQRETGKLAFDRGWWAWRQTSLQLFRIGALEYELSTLDGEAVIALHIPTDARLSPEVVDRSLEQAGLFFAAYCPDHRYEKYTCNSWLLSPRLKPFLGRDSNILAFQNRFCVLKDDPSDREFIQWLFHAPQDSAPERLPAETSLQKGVKKLLLSGGTVGCTCGVMERP